VEPQIAELGGMLAAGAGAPAAQFDTMGGMKAQLNRTPRKATKPPKEALLRLRGVAGQACVRLRSNLIRRTDEPRNGVAGGGLGGESGLVGLAQGVGVGEASRLFAVRRTA
jgi:hypothetical protein